MTAAPYLGWSSEMTDTQDLGTLWRRHLSPPTTELHVVFDMAPAPEPVDPPAPQRLPKRLRRRASTHLALAVASLAGFTTAALAGGMI